MYRNLYYDNKRGEINLWTWDSTGKRIKEIVPFEPFLYIESQSHKDAVSIYNTSLRKLSFKKQFDRYRFVQDSALKRIFYNLPVEQQFLIENFRTQNGSLEFIKNPLKIFFIDIETDSPNAFPEPKYAKDPINLITIYDSLKDEYVTWGLNNDYIPTRKNSTYTKCITEKELLLKFIKYWRSDFPDIVSGWNSETFDIPYIINRITNLFDDQKAKDLSPIGQLWFKEAVTMKFGKMEGRWNIKGISLLDYMNVYQTFARDKQESYALGYIAEVELGIGKTKIHAANLSAQANLDWTQFVEYNINDVALLVGLENKLQFLALMRMLAYTGLTNFEQAMGTISVVTGAMAIKGLERNQIIATFNHKAGGNYEGGYVKEPKRGMSEAVVSFDVNSLYPNTIVTLNLSPETKIGKINSREEGKVDLSLINGQTHTISEDQFIRFMKEKKLSLSKSNILFSQKSMGICPSLIDSIYKQRVTARNRLKVVKRKISKLDKTTQEYKDLKFESDQLDIKQYTLKIFLNRVYGYFANKYSPFYDLDLAASITITGQECIKEAGILVNNYLQSQYGITDDCILYSDTDSLYLTINPVLQSLKIPLAEKNQVTERVHEIVDTLEKVLNSEITKWAVNELFSTDSRLQFKRETICDVGIFLEKKRYILHILDEEGLAIDKTKYVGVEVASTNVPKKVKPLIKNIVETMIKTKSQVETNKAFREAYENFRVMAIEDIAFPKGINKVDLYSAKATNLTMGKGTPGHVRSAIAYNYFVEKFGIGNKYKKIQSGNKIKFFYTEKNAYRVGAIAFVDQYPSEFTLKPDIDKMFNKLVVAAIERLYNCLQWRIISPTKETQTDLFDLLS